MSGHSHWSTIKHRKETQDKKRGAIFSSMARILSVAAREGGADPETNFELRSAIEKARSVNMPNKNIERAIERGAGLGADREEWFKVNYEAFGPGQTALLIEGITNNKNRTLEEVRGILNKYGGKMSELGSVRWLFAQVGQITIAGSAEEKSDLEMKAIEAGADDLEWDEDDLIVYVKPDELEKNKKELTDKGINIKEYSLAWKPQKNIDLDDTNQEKLTRLLEALSEHDDIQEVYLNAEL